MLSRSVSTARQRCDHMDWCRQVRAVTTSWRYVTVRAEPTRTPSDDGNYVTQTLADPCVLTDVESIISASMCLGGIIL